MKMYIAEMKRRMRRFKYHYLRSKKQKEADKKAVHAALRATFTAAPATYYQDQPH